jgi:hypothetical protein
MCVCLLRLVCYAPPCCVLRCMSGTGHFEDAMSVKIHFLNSVSYVCHLLFHSFALHLTGPRTLPKMCVLKMQFVALWIKRKYI